MKVRPGVRSVEIPAAAIERGVARRLRTISPDPSSDPRYVSGQSRTDTRTRSGLLATRTGENAPLPPGFGWYGDEHNPIAPRFMADRPQSLHDVFFDFSVDSSTDGIWGSGVHLGDGFVLTAFHVVAHILRQGSHEDDFFYGDGLEPWNHRWQVKALPPRGSYNMDGGYIDPLGDGPFNDFAIVHAREKAGKRTVRGIRASSDLAPDEPIFIVGDRTAGIRRIERSALARDQSAAYEGTATIAACDLEAGFSGSPVVDTDGYLVGVIFGTDDVTSSMVRSESILPLIRGAETHVGLPSIETVGF